MVDDTEARSPEEMATGIIGMPKKKKVEAVPETAPETTLTIQSSKKELIPGGFNGVMERAKRALFGAPKPKYEIQEGYLTPKEKMPTAMDIEIARIKAERKAMALAEARKAYRGMRYVPSMAQPRVKRISEQIQKFKMPDQYAQRMEAIARGASRMPERFSGSFQGARSYEKGLSRTKSLGTGVAAFLFPQTGLGKRLKTAGMKRGSAGRPRGVYKHIIPGVGPVHVYTYRKWLRSQKRKAQEAIQARQNAMAQQLAKKGLPLDIAYAQAEMYNQARRQRAMEAAPEIAEDIAANLNGGRGLMQQYYEMPQQYPQMQQISQPQPSFAAQQPKNQMSVIGQPSRSPINMLGPDRLSNVFAQQRSQPAPPGYTEHYDIFSGRKTLVQKNEPSERWARDTSSISRPGMMGVRRANPNIVQMQGGYYYQ